jgi:predicted nucleotide-binding protein
MALHFGGEFEELQRLVRELKCAGEWRELGGGQAQFRSKDNAKINWWPKTGTLNVQGPPEVRERLERKIAAALGGEPVEAIAGAPEPAVGERRPTPDEKKVFVVHGHDVTAREQLELILHRLDLDPFVLANTGGGGMTIIEGLEKETGPGPGRCRFGIVLMTPDDMGYSKQDGADRAAPRARQNVVLEMGMLISALGRGNVAILKKGHLEEPSDVKGIIYLPFNDHVKETVPRLVDRLREAGFDLDQKAITKAST